MSEKTLLSRYMAALQKMPNPVRDTSAYKYKYAQLDQVLELVKNVLAQEGLAVYQRSICGERDYDLLTYITDGSEEKVIDTRSLLQSENAQVKGSYETYMRRYALLSAFGLAAEDDDGALTVSGKALNGSQNASESLSRASKPSGRFNKISELKAKCIEAGITESGLKYYIDTFGKPLTEFSPNEIAQVEAKFEQMLKDKEANSENE